MSELKELLRTAGVAVVGELVQHREKPHPNLYLGSGKVDELKPLLKAADANLVAVDDELTPRQERNLEEALGMPVIDRTAVILDIFAGHGCWVGDPHEGVIVLPAGELLNRYEKLPPPARAPLVG